MPWLLIRAMLLDQLRLFALTAGILVTVIAFGATIKPAAGESIITGLQVAKYMMLAIVPMLQYALPFAGGFAATLSMHRMTVDNEVQALAAGGVSYARILAPSVALGLLVSVAMFGLTQWTIPKFWGHLESMLSRDVAQLFASCVEQGVPFETDDLQISASEIQIQERPAGTQADTRLLLKRVAVAELGRDGRVDTDVTADRAAIDIYRRPGSTAIKFVLADTVAYNAKTGQLVQSPQIAPDRPIIIPSIRSDHTKAMTRTELLHLRDHPDEYSHVIEQRRELAGLLRIVQFRVAVADRLKHDRQVTFQVRGEPVRTYVVHATDMHGNEFHADDGPVRVEAVEHGKTVLRLQPRVARLDTGLAPALGDPAFDLVMNDVAVRDLRQSGTPSENVRTSLEAPGVLVSGLAIEDLDALQSPDLIARAEQALPTGHPRLDQEVQERIEKLKHEYDEVHREVTGRLMARYATVVAAPLLIILGATLAMFLRTSMPLTIYVWSFMPSVLALILLSAGEQMLRDGIFTGWFVLWSGNGILAAAIVWSYARLARN